MNHLVRLVACVAAASAFTGVSTAAVSPEEAKQLGGPVLTEFGAERAGNKDGSIPEYKAGLVKAPASYDPVNDRFRLPDPFNDKPLFSITAQNMAQYADKMTEGQKALLKTIKNYRMDIYPTRRTAYFPKFVIDNTLKNATSCSGGPNELSLIGCYGGVMFPIPKTGNQVVWNHQTRYQGQAWEFHAKAMYTTPDGKPITMGVNQMHQEYAIYDPKNTQPYTGDSLYYKIRVDTSGPARKAGEKLLLLYPMDPIKSGQRVYQYIPGQRRVKLSPDLSYDTPSPQSGGISTMDENSAFFGAQDRYDFKLIGKKEIYMLYNTYNTYDYKKCPEEVLIKPGFINPDCLRWELHRAWVVEAKLKPGFRHIYPRRTMYFDEDTWGAGSGDNYDAAGALYRTDFIGHYQYYAGGEGSPSGGYLHNLVTPTYTIDLLNGGYYSSMHMVYPGAGFVPEKPLPETFFSPEALAGQGIR